MQGTQNAEQVQALQQLAQHHRDQAKAIREHKGDSPNPMLEATARAHDAAAASFEKDAVLAGLPLDYTVEEVGRIEYRPKYTAHGAEQALWTGNVTDELQEAVQEAQQHAVAATF
jgi:D-alanine-D-alanine ligase-like ATP-grasp enzyme